MLWPDDFYIWFGNDPIWLDDMGLAADRPGAGMSLMILLTSMASMVVAIIAFNIKIIRNVEKIVPDADPKYRLDDYKKRLVRALNAGKLTDAQVKELYSKEKAKLFPKQFLP